MGSLEEREPLRNGVVVADAVHQGSGDGFHIALDLIEQHRIIDHHLTEVSGELLPDDANCQFRFAKQQRRRIGSLRQLGDLSPLACEALDVPADLCRSDVLGCGAQNHAESLRDLLGQQAAQPTPFTARKAPRDPRDAAAGDENYEAAGQGHLRRETSPLVTDRVLDDLAHDGLAIADQVADRGTLDSTAPTPAGAFALARSVFVAVVGGNGEITPVQHRLLGRPDVDECSFHARQHPTHPAHVQVAVDLRDVVGGATHVVLDERPALENSDVCRPLRNMDAHPVPTQRLAVAVFAAALGELLIVEFERLLIGQDRLDRCIAAIPRLGGP